MLPLIVGVFSCRRSISNPELDRYEAESKSGQEHLISLDYQAAEFHYNAPLAVAERMGWIDGRVMALRNISDVRVSARQFNEAEAILLNAKDECLSNKSCSDRSLASVYDKLIFLYLSSLKDIGKAERTANEVLVNRNRFSGTEDADELLIGYVRKMRTAGFEREADALETRIQSLEQ